MKGIVIIFGFLLISSVVAAFWNPFHIATAFCCLLMVINGISHIKESV